jgi:Ca2+-binding RTX toxin-like protein
MSIEQLESRRLMSVVVYGLNATLYVKGDDAANGIRIERDGYEISVKHRPSGGTYSQIFRIADSSIDKVQVDGGFGNDMIEVDKYVTAAVTINGGNGADWIKTGGVTCDAWGNYAPGTSNIADDLAADIMIAGGTVGSSFIAGQGGHDKLYTGMTGYDLGLSGKDYLVGGPGNDTFYTRTGNIGRWAEVWGDSGDDTLRGGPNRHVRFDGGDGTDHVDFSDFGQAARISLNGGTSGELYDPTYEILESENATGTPFGDLILGGEGANVLWGMNGNDSIGGHHGNDLLFGGEGNDQLGGGWGADVLYGEGGNDTLEGGGGVDLMFGGNGDDKFLAQDGYTDQLFGGAGTDTILQKDPADVFV